MAARLSPSFAYHRRERGRKLHVTGTNFARGQLAECQISVGWIVGGGFGTTVSNLTKNKWWAG